MERKSPEQQKTVCERMLRNAVTNNSRVHQLVDSITELGCSIPKDFFACRSCDAKITGGFAVDSGADATNEKELTPQIILCQNHIVERETFENTIVHELVHAYDVCRAKVDFKNCKEMACAEIRASALSGECAVLHEAYRGHVKLSGGHPDCVKRRAALSCSMNPYCEGKGAEVVESVFAKCYSDSAPFDRV